MKKFILASVAAIGLLASSQQQASAWGSFSFGVGIGIGCGNHGVFIGAGFAFECAPRYIPYFPSEYDVYAGGGAYPVDPYAAGMSYGYPAPAYYAQQPAAQVAPVAPRPAAPAPIYQPVSYQSPYNSYQAPAYWYSR